MARVDPKRPHECAHRPRGASRWEVRSWPPEEGRSSRQPSRERAFSTVRRGLWERWAWADRRSCLLLARGRRFATL